MAKIKLGGIFYPTNDENGKQIPFDTLYLPYIWKEIYFDSIYTDILNGKKDMVIVDVGSQIGLTVKYFQPYCKKLYAIEPSTESYTALVKNKEFNDWDNVETFNLALADRDGEMTLNKLDSNRTCHSLNNDYGQGGEKVETMRFDTFMEKNKIFEVDFCKFDVENMEDVILRSEGFLKIADRIKSIEVEFHNPQWPALVEHMIKLGYTARRYEASAIIILFTR